MANPAYLQSGRAPKTAATDPCKDERVVCKRCNLLLAYAMESSGKTELRVRYKDFRIKVLEPESLTITCRRCSFDNTLARIPVRQVPLPSGGGSTATPASVPSGKGEEA